MFKKPQEGYEFELHKFENGKYIVLFRKVGTSTWMYPEEDWHLRLHYRAAGRTGEKPVFREQDAALLLASEGFDSSSEAWARTSELIEKAIQRDKNINPLKYSTLIGKFKEIFSD